MSKESFISENLGSRCKIVDELELRKLARISGVEMIEIPLEQTSRDQLCAAISNDRKLEDSVLVTLKFTSKEFPDDRTIIINNDVLKSEFVVIAIRNPELLRGNLVTIDNKEISYETFESLYTFILDRLKNKFLSEEELGFITNFDVVSALEYLQIKMPIYCTQVSYTNNQPLDCKKFERDIKESFFNGAGDDNILNFFFQNAENRDFVLVAKFSVLVAYLKKCVDYINAEMDYDVNFTNYVWNLYKEREIRNLKMFKIYPYPVFSIEDQKYKNFDVAWENIINREMALLTIYMLRYAGSVPDEDFEIEDAGQMNKILKTNYTLELPLDLVSIDDNYTVGERPPIAYINPSLLSDREEQIADYQSIIDVEHSFYIFENTLPFVSNITLNNPPDIDDRETDRL